MKTNASAFTSASTRTLVPASLAVLLLLLPRAASANPRPLPFTYPYETLPEGEAEIEQYVDTTPLRSADEGGTRIWEPSYVLQTEYEYGITDRLELGLYLVFANDAGGPLVFDGTKQRLRFRLAEQDQWPVDVALYGEVAEKHDEFELEEKIIVTKRFGDVRLMTNLWFEQGFERYQGEPEFVANPTLGVTGQITPSFHVGAEYWMHAKLGEEEEAAPAATPAEQEVQEFNDAAHHYLGPAVSLQFGKLWWSTAAYLRLDQMKRATEIGDKFGHVWVRTVIGLSL
jgi:hypothetical protein